MTRLRVASYNTRDFLDNRAAAARVVRAIDPDVLCLQEVPRRLLAGRRVSAFARACGLTWPGGHRGSGGTTILLRPGLPVKEVHHERLRTALFDRTRGFALVRLDLGGEPGLLIASVHLSLKAGERVRHTAGILRALDDDPSRIIVAGDLNEGADGAAFRMLDRRLRIVSPDAPTYPVHRPHRRLDLIFADPELSVESGAPVHLPEDDVRAASDHRPVWADLVLPD